MEDYCFVFVQKINTNILLFVRLIGQLILYGELPQPVTKSWIVILTNVVFIFLKFMGMLYLKQSWRCNSPVFNICNSPGVHSEQRRLEYNNLSKSTGQVSSPRPQQFVMTVLHLNMIGRL